MAIDRSGAPALDEQRSSVLRRSGARRSKALGGPPYWRSMLYGARRLAFLELRRSTTQLLRNSAAAAVGCSGSRLLRILLLRSAVSDLWSDAQRCSGTPSIGLSCALLLCCCAALLLCCCAAVLLCCSAARPLLSSSSPKLGLSEARPLWCSACWPLRCSSIGHSTASPVRRST